MHIPDILIFPNNPTNIAILAITWALAIPFILFAWKKTKENYSHSIAASLAISSALVFVAQMLAFPIPGGTTVHILGGTLLALILGPYPAMLSMTMVLLMQAVFFGDGGLLTFGANVFNMAIIGGLSFFMIKLTTGNSTNKARLATSIFLVSWIAPILTALATGLEIGFSTTFANSGGIMLTVPAMVTWYAIAGLVEAAVTTGISTSIQRFQPTVITGFKLLQEGRKV